MGARLVDDRKMWYRSTPPISRILYWLSLCTTMVFIWFYGGTMAETSKIRCRSIFLNAKNMMAKLTVLAFFVTATPGDSSSESKRFTTVTVLHESGWGVTLGRSLVLSLMAGDDNVAASPKMGPQNKLLSNDRPYLRAYLEKFSPSRRPKRPSRRNEVHFHWTR